MKLKTLWACLAVAGLAACGGDGGSDGPAPTPSTSAVTLQGVASKGVLGQAVVSVHPVKADGSVDTATVLATATTADNGTYTLPAFQATPGAAYVVVVKAGAGTFTLDEVTNTQVPLPSTFVLRGLLIAPSGASAPVVAHVTPFSELAVAAAAGAPGGVSVANATQALANVRVLLGFDPATTTPMTIQAATTPEQQTLAVLLTAVSKLANDSELGCATGDLGARTACVVTALGASASLTSTKPGTANGFDVSAELAQSAAAVVADPKLTEGTSVNAGTVNTVTGNLQGDGAVVQPGTIDRIAAANALFNGLRSDVTALFGKTGADGLGASALELEASKFEDAMRGVQVPVEMVAMDVGAMLMGIDLYNDYTRNGGATSRSRNDGAPLTGCTLYADALATTPLQANVPGQAVGAVGCGADYRTLMRANHNVDGQWVSTTTTRWRHGFTLVRQADGTFHYGSNARRRVETCVQFNCTLDSNEALQANAATGVVTPTLDANGRMTGAKVIGDLPGAFGKDRETLVDDRTTVDLAGTRAIAADNTSTTTLQGTAVSKDAAGGTLGTLTIKSGSTTEVAVSVDANGNVVARNSPAAVRTFGSDLATASLSVLWTTAGAEFEGDIALTESLWDKSGRTHLPTKGTLNGALRNIENGNKTEFFNGRILAGITGLAAYDASAEDTAANNVSVSLVVIGEVTAPGRPKLQLSASTTVKSHEDRPSNATVTYKSIVNGTPVRQVSLAASLDAEGKYAIKLSEAASNLSLTYVEGAASANLMAGSDLIGVFTNRDKLVTYVDKSQVSLDFGL